ncbi:MAG: hypothetical protein CM15mV22_2140 [Eurybiavirus sp.]|nr:MAG: hypothetical protein CM15mV22_2140 [Eurybiavirus sp.]
MMVLHHSVVLQAHSHTHMLVVLLANAVTVVTDSNTQKDVTNAVYNPTNGQVELTIGNHSYTTSDTVKIAVNSLTFTCDEDSNATTTHTQDLLILHTNKYYQFLLRLLLQLLLLLVLQYLLLATAYPRSEISASGKWLTVSERTANTLLLRYWM